MIMVVLLVISLAGISLAMVSLTGSGYLEGRGARESMRAFQLSEAGLSQAWAVLEELEEDELVLACAAPLDFGPDSVDVQVTLGSVDPTLRFDRLMISASSSDSMRSSTNTMLIGKVPNGNFRFAIFGETEVVLESNALVDSYNSITGPYDSSEPGELADVGSNGDIELNANIDIYGNVIAGPTGIIDEAAPGINVDGDLSTADAPFTADPIPVPLIVSSGPQTVGGALTIGPGDIHYSSLLVQGGGALTIIGPARIVLDDLEVLANALVNIDATGGAVEIHCLGDVELRSNSDIVTTSNRALDILFNVAWDPFLASTYNFDLSSNSAFEGVIFAPESDVVLSSNFEIFGAIYADTMTLESNAQVHFDENLLFDDGVPVEYTRVSWCMGPLN